MELNEYQRLANQTDQQPAYENPEAYSPSIMVPLLGLAGEVGELLDEHKKWLRDGESYKLFPERVKEELGDLLWYLSNVATKHGITLGDVAEFNLHKIGSRWQPAGTDAGTRKLFDEHFPPSERLPRQMTMSIEEEMEIVTITFDGAKYVHTLTVNRYEDRGYRFHDICHLSYASVLGWSPTMRALVRRKRKSDPKVDEVEDGARAIAIEEGISAMVFSYAEGRNFLEGADGVHYAILRAIKDMTSHLEVGVRAAGEWERAIMMGFEIWRQVKNEGRGQIRADLERRTIELVG